MLLLAACANPGSDSRSTGLAAPSPRDATPAPTTYAGNGSTGFAVTGPPLVAYTDLVAGPVSGGENNLGAYVSIFGKNFGADPARVHVFFGATEVAAYRYLGASRGRSDIQQLTVQPGPVGSGTLPIKVVVDGVASNTDHTFLVNPGDILFVDNVAGSDFRGKRNNIARPWRSLQTPGEDGALGEVRPGDVLVLRGKGVWSDIGYDNRWVRLRHVTGSRPTGAKGTGYITIEAYPNENVHYVAPPNTSGGIHGVGEGFAEYADWIVISGLHIESNGSSRSDGAPINLQVASDHWRVVNNELGPWPAGPHAGDKAGALAGDGKDVAVLGNHIHDIGGGTENHGLYFDTGTDKVEVAYNHIHDITGGNLIQTFDNLGSGTVAGLDIHHNLLHDGGRYGLNIADNTARVHAWDNVIYNTAYAGIRLNVNTGLVALFEHNTLLNVCTNHPAEPGAIENSWDAGSGSITFQYNIVAATRPACPHAYDSDATDSAVSFTRNLYFGYSVPDRDTSAISAEPLFKDAARFDLHLLPDSRAGDAALGSDVMDDYDLTPRSRPDVGAFELQP
jgi:hypothetical protein